MKYFIDKTKTYLYNKIPARVISYCLQNNICLIKTAKGKTKSLRLPLNLPTTIDVDIPIVTLAIGEEIKVIKTQLETDYFKDFSNASKQRIANFIYMQKLAQLNK